MEFDILIIMRTSMLIYKLNNSKPVLNYECIKLFIKYSTVQNLKA